MKIKVVLVVLSVICLLVSGTTVLAAERPTDVPTEHWAYQAVQSLLDKGYLSLYQDRSFRGDQAVDRYTFASVVAKLLEEITAESNQKNASRDDIDKLRNLSNEFRGELVKILGNNSELVKKLDELYRQNEIFKEDLTNTNVTVQNLQEQVHKLQAELRETQKKQKTYFVASIILAAIAAASK